MKRSIIALALLLSAKSAFAYGPSPLLISSQNFKCSVQTADGRTLLPTITRTLFESRREANVRFLNSDLHLSDGTGVETGDGNLDHLLKPFFGAARFDESSETVALESQKSGKELEMKPLTALTKSIITAWQAESQNDMTIKAQIIPKSADVLALQVTFSVRGQDVRLRGTCLAQK